MFRRIALWVLAAGLIATSARAERVCLDKSCRMPDVAAPLVQAQIRGMGAAQDAAAQSDHALVWLPAAVGDRGPLRPKAVAEQRPRLPVTSGAGDARARHADPEATESLDASRHAPRVVRGGWHGSGYVVGGQPAPHEIVVAVPGVIDGEGQAVPAHPYQGPSAGWQLCQISPPDDRLSHSVCSPYNYHPFGAHGYRPNGGYRAEGGGPVFLLAPGAKIISLDPRD